jgi:hypothetical protein
MKKLLIFTLFLSLLLGACAVKATPTPSPSKEMPPMESGGMGGEMLLMPQVESRFAGGVTNARQPGAGAAVAPADRLVIQNVNLALVVSDVEKKMAEISRLATEMGGYVVSSSLYKVKTPAGQEAPEGNITIRVPAARLDEALSRIEEQVVEVREESRNGQDVTREYVDLQSRLRNLEAAEKQLMEIMQEAKTTEDVMNVFNQLVSIREQIEQVKGQIKYYEESAALSAISIRLIAEETVKPLEIGGWKPKGVARDALQSLIYFLQGFVNFLIRFFLYYLWVILLSVVLPLWLAYRIVRFALRRRKKSAAPESGKGS